MASIKNVIIGLALIFAPIWWILKGSFQYLGRSGLEDLLIVINGGLPVLLVLFGLLILWIELEDYKIERELKRKSKKRKK